MNSRVLVLLVEDDPDIQNLLVDALEEGGFDVIQAFDGDEGVKVLQDRNEAIRALVTDINFPATKTTGWDVARTARELIPELPVIYMTGASADEWGSKGIPNSVLINKPFAPAQIITAVSQLLNAGNAPTPDGPAN